MSLLTSEASGGPLGSKGSLFEYYEEGMSKGPSNPAAIVMFQPAEHLSELVTAQPRPSTNVALMNESSKRDHKHRSFLTWTYQELHQASILFINALLRAGVQSEKSKVVSFIPNGIEYPLLAWTTVLARLTLSCLDPGALQPKRHLELQNFLVSLSPDVVLVPDSAGAEAVDEILISHSLPQPKVKLIVPAANTNIEVSSGWQTLSNFVMSEAHQPLKNDDALRKEAKSVNPHHVSLILFTSGTSSGKPKGCLREVKHTCHLLEAQSWITPRGADTRALLAGANFRTMSHAFVAQTWYAGGAVILPYINFSPEVTLQAIEEHCIDVLIMVPFHFHAIIDHPQFRATDVSSVRMVRSGGDMVTKDFLEKLKAAFPQADQVAPGHGMTEGGGVFDWPFGTEVTNLPYFGGIAPLGKVAEGARVRIVDKATGNVTKRGEPGELHVSSAVFSTSYLGGVKQEDWYTDDMGIWFITGDLSMMAEDGSVYILGRIKDIIKRAGIPITPAALENCIETYTKCRCSVIGIPHPTLGSEPFAVVQNFDLVNEDQIKQRVLDEFGKDYSLRGTASLQQLGLDQFPLNASAKIMKIELEQPVLRYLAITVN